MHEYYVCAHVAHVCVCVCVRVRQIPGPHTDALARKHTCIEFLIQYGMRSCVWFSLANPMHFTDNASEPANDLREMEGGGGLGECVRTCVLCWPPVLDRFVSNTVTWTLKQNARVCTDRARLMRVRNSGCGQVNRCTTAKI